MKRFFKPRIALTAALGALAVGAAVLAMPTAAQASDLPPVPAFGSYATSSTSAQSGCTATIGYLRANNRITDQAGAPVEVVGSPSDGGEDLGALEELRGWEHFEYLNAYPDVATQDFTYFRGTDGHLHAVARCLHWNGFNNYPSIGVQDLGGGLTSSPSAVKMNGVPFVFVRGDDGGLWYNTIAARGKYIAVSTLGPAAETVRDLSHKWVRIGGYFVGDPVAVARPNGRIDVFVVNQNGEVWDARSTDAGASFHYLAAGSARVGAGWSNIAAGYGASGNYVFGQINLSTRECSTWDSPDPTSDIIAIGAGRGDLRLGVRWPDTGPVIAGGKLVASRGGVQMVTANVGSCASWQVA